MSITRTLFAALAAAALAAPAASAQPADDLRSADAKAAAKTHTKQELRPADANVGSYTPGAIPAVTYPSDATAGGVYTPGATAIDSASKATEQDRRSPDARDAVNAPGATAIDSASVRERDLRHLRAGGDIAQRPLPGPPTWPAHPRPLPPAPAAKVTDGGNGVDWTTIALGIAGSLLAIGGITALTARSRRLQRQRAIA